LIEAERIGKEVRLRGRLPCLLFQDAPKNVSNRPSAETLPGTSVRDAASVPATTSFARRRMREKANSVRNAYSTLRNDTH
jgi:hypothetical protein